MDKSSKTEDSLQVGVAEEPLCDPRRKSQGSRGTTDRQAGRGIREVDARSLIIRCSRALRERCFVGCLEFRGHGRAFALVPEFAAVTLA